MSLSGKYLALDSASVVTALGGLLVAMIAAAVALWQVKRVQSLEREKIQLETAAQMRLKEQEWQHERQVTARERRRAAREAEQERERAAERVAAHRTTLEAGAAAYCGRLVQELSTLRILDMSRPLRLERLYVQVGVQEQQPLRFLSADEVERQARRTDGERRTWRTEAERAEARAAAESHAAVHTYAPVDALQRYRRIVVVGDPGAGKTTMLRHLALRMATQSEHESLPVLPAYVELFRFVESGHESLLDHLAEHWADHYGFEDARDYIVEKLTDGSAALLLDGLDEVLGGESAREAESAYHRVTAELTRLATRFPRAPIATTCRRQGWRGGLSQFQVLEALDFEWPQIETFVANWFGAGDRRRAGLVRALSANGRLQTLAANPLLLSLIAIVYERDLELPERRAALYQRCVEVLLREWDAHRKISRYSRFTTDRKQDLLKEIARHYHQRGLRYFPEDDLLDQIARFLPTIDLAPEDSRAILDEIAAQYGLLKPQAHGWYGFLHLTLQEHFTAAALLERGADGIQQAVRARYDPWWEEVILLLAGSLPDASPLLSGLLQLEPDRPRTDAAGLLDLPDDDLFHTDLLLAARCLTGSPRVADVALRREIVASVWHLLDGSQYPDEKRRAAEALVGVARSDAQLDEIVAYICDEQRDSEARLALIQALEAHGGRRVGERLLGVFGLGGVNSFYLREALITALGTLRVEAAVPALRAELERKLTALAGAPARDNWSAAKDIAMIMRALGQAGAPAEVFLHALESRTGSPWFSTIAAAARDALKNTREPGTAERLLELLLRPLDNEDVAGGLSGRGGRGRSPDAAGPVPVHGKRRCAADGGPGPHRRESRPRAARRAPHPRPGPHGDGPGPLPRAGMPGREPRRPRRARHVRHPSRHERTGGGRGDVGGVGGAGGPRRHPYSDRGRQRGAPGPLEHRGRGGRIRLDSAPPRLRPGAVRRHGHRGGPAGQSRAVGSRRGEGARLAVRLLPRGRGGRLPVPAEQRRAPGAVRDPGSRSAVPDQDGLPVLPEHPERGLRLPAQRLREASDRRRCRRRGRRIGGLAGPLPARRRSQQHVLPAGSPPRLRSEPPRPRAGSARRHRPAHRAPRRRVSGADRKKTPSREYGTGSSQSAGQALHLHLPAGSGTSFLGPPTHTNRLDCPPTSSRSIISDERTVDAGLRSPP
ncbi:NACHT domain-containing protein [Streptomyces sp. NBC_00638]|uniref:NACHT domain-containing protein n=1 Tax=Streptomyces sp. NBC_00638 TaxID=2975794 RepID=UPI00224F0BCF|nr:NACHT domain-containing protein [Streptomyces sp. NBC_00638]MCX5008715.1 NACHT domain-containing protein [Streptomyces sp. NBC_00638]